MGLPVFASAVINLARNSLWPRMITLLLAPQPHTCVYISIAEQPGHCCAFAHALRFKLPKYTMETESESSTSGDDSVFWLDSEVITQVTGSEEGEGEEHFR